MGRGMDGLRDPVDGSEVISGIIVGCVGVDRFFVPQAKVPL